jgi:hypothetical protein
MAERIAPNRELAHTGHMMEDLGDALTLRREQPDDYTLNEDGQENALRQITAAAKATKKEAGSYSPRFMSMGRSREASMR